MASDLATRIQKLVDDPYFHKQFDELMEICYETAVEKGWHNPSKTFGEQIALFHSEITEALEEFRAGHLPYHVYEKDGKPEGVPVEFADLLIRVMDTCGLYNINLLSTILDKMKYNLTRSNRHGGKVL